MSTIKTLKDRQVLLESRLESLCFPLGQVLESAEPKDEEAVKNTPARFYKAMKFLLSGYFMENPLNKEFDFVRSDDLVIVKNIPFFSLCKHHILPFFGHAHVGYLPKNKVVGLSKLARVIEMYSRRLQLQERMGRQICDTIQKSAVAPKGVIVVLEAQHMCMQMRGVESVGSVTTTSSISGEFKNNSDLKREFFHLIGRNNAH